MANRKQTNEEVMMNYLIRKASVEDENDIRSLYVLMLKTIYHTEDVQDYETGYLDKFWSDSEDRVYVAQITDDNANEKKVIAFLSVEVYRDEQEYIYLDDLSVSKQYRDNGIGSALIKEAENYVKDIGITTIVFHVEKSNEAAFRLYERLGYRIFRDDGNRYLMRKDLV